MRTCFRLRLVGSTPKTTRGPSRSNTAVISRQPARGQSKSSCLDSPRWPARPARHPCASDQNASNIHSRSIRWCSEVNTRSGCFLASSAIHCRFVDRFSGLRVPPVFPAMVLIAWRPPSLRRVPASPVPRPLRYYEAATTSRRACPSAYVFASGFRPGSIVRVRCRAPGDVRAHRRARSLCSPGAPGSRAFPYGRRRDLSGSLATPPAPLPCSETPAEIGRGWPCRRDRCCPRTQHGEGFGAFMISRLPQGFSARCLRFTNAVAAARAGLASGWRAPPLPGGRRTLWVALKGFRSHPSSFPGLTLTQAGRM